MAIPIIFNAINRKWGKCAVSTSKLTFDSAASLARYTIELDSTDDLKLLKQAVAKSTNIQYLVAHPTRFVHPSSFSGLTLHIPLKKNRVLTHLGFVLGGSSHESLLWVSSPQLFAWDKERVNPLITRLG